MSRIVEIIWKIGDEHGVPFENLKTRKYIFEVPSHWVRASGWTDEDIIRSATMELAKDAYNSIRILDTKVLAAKIVEKPAKVKGGAE